MQVDGNFKSFVWMFAKVKIVKGKQLQKHNTASIIVRTFTKNAAT